MKYTKLTLLVLKAHVFCTCDNDLLSSLSKDNPNRSTASINLNTLINTSVKGQNIPWGKLLNDYESIIKI